MSSAVLLPASVAILHAGAPLFTNGLVAIVTLQVRRRFSGGAIAIWAALYAVFVVHGREPEVGGAGYWADSGFIAAAGIPTVLFGPSGAGAHAVEEWISLRDTELVARTLVEVAKRFCR